jgi:hypothetical protein
MPRFGSWASCALVLLLGCSKDAPATAVIPPWQVLVTGVRPGHAAAPPALSVCEANGSACSPIKSGVTLQGNRLVRLERGVGQFKLDDQTSIEVAEGTELLLEDKGGRSIELRSGGIVLSRDAAAPQAGSLLIRMVDRTLELVGRTAIVASLENINRGQIFVTRGVVSAVEPPGSMPPLRQFHPGEGAVFERKAPPDLHAVFAGAISQFRQSVLAVQDTPSPPPKALVEPRGLGSMTARVPGTTAVITGVRLAKHHVRAVVRDGVAQTEVEEVFQNDTDKVLEGRYVFPLPADATISGLTLFVGDEPIEGELVEKTRAAAIFRGIVEDTVRPRDPALLEWVQGSKFSLKVFPIPAKGSRKVILRYQQVLTSDGPRQVYVYPLSLGAERRTPIDDLAIDVDVSDGSGPVQGVVASGYAAEVEQRPLGSHVTLRQRASAPDHDFALSFVRAAPRATVATAEQGFVAMRLRAELPSTANPPPFQARDRVVVVDASHSQSAESLAAARDLTAGILRALEPEERFALLVCDSACDAVPPSGLAPASGKPFDDALAMLAARKPAGASDLAGALVAAAERVPSGTPVQVVYVGDGSASAGELGVASIAARARSSFDQRVVDLRLLGAGVSVDEQALAGLARELAGSYQSVSAAGALADRVEALSAALRSPLLVAPQLEVPPSITELEPRVLPNLRLGEEFVVVGKFAGGDALDVKLRGTLARAPYELSRSVSVKPSSGAAAPFAPRLWAESRIRTLQAGGLKSALAEIIDVSKKFRVMSRETSWLVLESEQMFADFGIARSRGEQEAPSSNQLAKELDLLGRGAPGSTGSEPDFIATPLGDAKNDALSGSRGPGAPPAAAPAPPAKAAEKPSESSFPDASGGGLGGLGSTGKRGGSGVGSTVAGPRGTATVGSAAVSGGTVANAARVVAGMRAGFRNCYQRGLAEDPAAAGSIRLGIRVGAQGQVTGVAPAPTGTLPASVVACVVARARAAQFDPPEGGNSTIEVPITFKLDSVVSPSEPRIPIGALGNPRVAQDVAVIRVGDENWQGQGQAALDKLQAELLAAPDSRKKHEALVRGLLQRGRFAPALAAAERFVELDPDLPVARELLSYAAVASGDRKRAVAAVDAMTEAAPRDLKAHGRAARAFEALDDEPRACAHWRSMLELAPTSDSAQFEALRCRARVLGDRTGAVRDAKAVSAPGPLLQKLLPLLESGQLPRFERSSGSPGQFETILTCDQADACPYVIVITPTGTVFSPWTPALGRSGPTSFAFSGLLSGQYRVLLIGGALTARGKVEVRALNGRSSFEFAPGHLPTVATVQVTMAPAGAGGGLGSLRF